MSTNQSNNNKQNEFVVRERTHNMISTAFFLLLSLIFIFLIVAGSLLNSIYVIVPSAILLLFSVIKLIYQFKTIFSFNKLTKSVEEDHISFYISKSWNRKKEATKWFSVMGEIVICIPVIVLLIINPDAFLFSILTLFLLVVFILIAAYLNLQTLEGYLKLSERKMNMHSVEWLQIKKEQKIFYRLMFVYFVSLITIIPIFLLIIPAYRKAIYNLVKK